MSTLSDISSDSSNLEMEGVEFEFAEREIDVVEYAEREIDDEVTEREI